jgi:spore coat protein U-like protein
VTPARSLLIVVLALAVLIGAQPGAEAQFPRGLLAAGPGEKSVAFCTIETRPLSFGTYDPVANANLDALSQIIYTCSNQGKKIRIEMSPGIANQFDRHMTAGTSQDFLNYNIYLDATRQTVWGNGTNGTDAYFENNPPNNTPVVVPMYGRVFARQDVPTGQYVDVVHVVILF